MECGGSVTAVQGCNRRQARMYPALPTAGLGDPGFFIDTFLKHDLHSREDELHYK